MLPIFNVTKFQFDSVPIDPFWNSGNEKEVRMHRIHSYPAKFPSFITTKAINYYNRINNNHISKIADIFCGCGTTAFEAKRNNIEFWGCDINPVATLIASVKSRKYQPNRLKKYLRHIENCYNNTPKKDVYHNANERLKYWHKKKQYNDLSHLKMSIFMETPPNSDYQLFFFCAFSNILKSTSVWLTKSIKPQVDPRKKPADVYTMFIEQCNRMLKANNDIQYLRNSKTEIVTGDFLAEKVSPPKVDMIVTSPPYVTSYEYADLHQLSSLWLDYTTDYRSLRNGSIGSLHHDYNFSREMKRLNDSGTKIVSILFNSDKSKAKSVAKYYLDIQAMANKTYNMLNKNGLALFVIGNTEYKDVHINNAQHLAESLFNSGFSEMVITKRKISNKILTPYRDATGKFSTDAAGRKVYNEEFIIIGRK